MVQSGGLQLRRVHSAGGRGGSARMWQVSALVASSHSTTKAQNALTAVKTWFS